MSNKRENYQASIAAIQIAIDNFDRVAVENNDSFARKQYHELIDVMHTIKTDIVESEEYDFSSSGC